MNIVIIVGSPRKDSQSKRVGEYIQSVLQTKDIKVHLHCLGETPLPLYDDTLEESPEQQAAWNPLAEKLLQCDGAIFITPEWNGMAAPALKNFCMFVEGELTHKPVLLVAVTSGATNGAYPIAEMRMTSYKNNHICYIPEHLIVRNVEQCFGVYDEQNIIDNKTRERMHWALDILTGYATALKTMRETSTVDLTRYPYGM